jgi:ketosteroid isomerase-like protein
VPVDEDFLRDAYRALDRGEWHRSAEFMHPRISWHFVEGAAPDAPDTLRGPDEIVDFWRTFFDAWEEWEMTPQQFVESADGRIMVSVQFTARGSGSGVPLELEFCQLLTVIDAKIYRVDQYLSRDSAEQDCVPSEPPGR